MTRTFVVWQYPWQDLHPDLRDVLGTGLLPLDFQLIGLLRLTVVLQCVINNSCKQIFKNSIFGHVPSSEA